MKMYAKDGGGKRMEMDAKLKVKRMKLESKIRRNCKCQRTVSANENISMWTRLVARTKFWFV